MWSDLREATRMKSTKSGTPPFQVRDGNQDQCQKIGSMVENPDAERIKFEIMSLSAIPKVKRIVSFQLNS